MGIDLSSLGSRPPKPTGINAETNTVIIGSTEYEFSYKLGGRKVELYNMAPKDRETFLLRVREVAMRITKPGDDIERYNFSFDNNEFAEVKCYGPDDVSIISRIAAKDPLLTGFDKDLNQLILKANDSLKLAHKEDLPIRGVSRGIFHNSCWLGTGLQLFAQAYWHQDLSEFPELQSAIRKITKSEKGGIDESHLGRIANEMVAGGLGCPPLTNQADPADFLGQFTHPQVQTINALPNQTAQTIIRNNPPGVNTTSIIVTLQRNTGAGTKDTSPVALEKTVDVGNDTYELVALAEHQGSTPTSGHYVAYTNQSDRWIKCDDDKLHLEPSEADLFKRVENNVTHLVYRKLPQLRDNRKEQAIRPLFSPSRVDFDKWLGSDIIKDYAKKTAATVPNGMILTTSSGRTFHTGAHNDKVELLNEIHKNPGKCLIIPMIQYSDPNDIRSRHWVSVVIDQTRVPTQIEYFDSTGKSALMDLHDLGHDLGYPVVEVLDRGTRWQKDGWRCGYYALYYLALRVNNSVTDIQAMTGPRQVGGSRDEINRFRGDLQMVYNRYQPNYGFT